MSVLDIKLVRDLKALWAQVLSIALLLAAGTAVFLMSISDYLALVRAMDTHYHNERFADVFAGVKRAPLPLAARLREIDGVGVAETRIVEPIRVLRLDTDLPLAGRIVSIPASGQPQLNRLYLLEGRWIEADRPDEVIINAAYAEARGVRPGDGIDVVLNGRLETFAVVGIALSPEFVFATRAAVPLPDDRNFVVLWAGENAVGSAFNMKGAFNDVVLTLAPQASQQGVLAEVERVLAPYGGTGAFGRNELPSHRFLEDELAEQRTLSIVMPGVFFTIAAFLLNVVLGRLVAAQREQIASLRALGFPKQLILRHYFKFVTAIALLGVGLGVVMGRWLAILVIQSYRAFFRFPVLEAQFDGWIFLVALTLALASANGAAALAVLRIARIAPAEAMRPQPPAASRFATRLSLLAGRRVKARRLMALRTVLGRPVRTLLTIFGIALSVPLVLFGLFWFDAIAYMLDTTFERIERGDAFLSFTAPVSRRAVFELGSTPGVLLAEGQRVVPARLVSGHRSYLTSVTGLDEPSDLKVMREADLTPITVPPEGVMLTRRLAERLGLKIGDLVTIEVLEGKRPVREVEVVKTSEDLVGLAATMNLKALNRILGDGDVINAAALKIDPAEARATWRAIGEIPKVEANSSKSLWLDLFNQSIAGMIIVGAAVLAGFGLLITFGVVYNSARVALQERAWELASLRILGFTRHEVTLLLLSELAIEVVLAIPLGLLIGKYLIELIASLRESETFQIPAVIEPSSYATTALVVLAAAAASAYVVHRRIATLDLVSTLKTRD